MDFYGDVRNPTGTSTVIAGSAALTRADHSRHTHESRTVSPGCTEVVKNQKDIVRMHSSSHCWVWQSYGWSLW